MYEIDLFDNWTFPHKSSLRFILKISQAGFAKLNNCRSLTGRQYRFMYVEEKCSKFRTDMTRCIAHS